VIGEFTFSVPWAVSALGTARIPRTSAHQRWRDDVWTMKYLSGFKWEMLGEQVGMFFPLFIYPTILRLLITHSSLVSPIIIHQKQADH